MRKKTLLLFLILIVGLQVSLSAQTKNISGKIIDNKGKSLPGVSVITKGSTIGTISDTNGNYSIKVPNKYTTLVFSFIGMTSQEIDITGKSIINITLSQDTKDLDEVMVVAYGTAKKSTYTGAATVVDSKRLHEAQVSNVSNALQGTSTGVQVTSTTGQPGASSTIRIRGIGSLTATSSPLYIVDGVAYDGNLNSINPSDIKSVTVLKDAASSAIYGSRAANGVIVITTREGYKNKKAQISIKSTIGISSRAIKPIDRLGTNDYMELSWEAMRNGYLDNGSETDMKSAGERASKELIPKIGINPYGTGNPEPVGYDGKIKHGLNPLWDNDWDKAIIGTGVRYETNINVSGGSDKTQYYFSGSYLKDKGMMLRSGFKRTSVRMNLNNQTTNWLKLNLNINFAHSKTTNNDSQDSNVGNGATYGLNLANFYPIYQRNRKNGNFILDANGNKKYDYGLYRGNSFKKSNLIAYLPQSIDEAREDLISIKGSTVIDFAKINKALTALKGLKLSTNYSTNINSSNNHTYSFDFSTDQTDPNNYDVIPDLQSASALRDNNTVRSFTFNNLLTYNRTFANIHSISILLGQELYGVNTTYTGGQKNNFPLPKIKEPTFGSTVYSFSASSELYRLNSYFTKLEYGYNGKYNASFSYRFDGSSKFYKDNRWGRFWSIGTSWNINKENFLKDNRIINLLRLRASYGGSGNQNIGTYYAWQNFYDSSKLGSVPGISLSRMGNKDLQWEGNLSTNIGLDYGLCNVIRGNIEWFQRISDNLIYNQPLPSTSGFSDILTNVGKLRNQGFEFNIKTDIINKKNTHWELDINATHYKNKLISYPIKEGTINGLVLLKEGHDIHNLFIREWAGNTKGGETTYVRNADKSISKAPNLAKGGQASWYIIDKKSGEKYRTTNYYQADRIEAGSTIPDLYGGISTEIRIHNFSISALLSYSLGGKIYAGGNYISLFGHNNNEQISPWAASMKDRWTPSNPESDLPRLTSAQLSSSWSNTSTRHLHNASYARLKNISLSYNLPKRITNKIGMIDVSVFVQGENLITIFGIDGIDPETGSGYNYPVSKVFSGGISLKF